MGARYVFHSANLLYPYFSAIIFAINFTRKANLATKTTRMNKNNKVHTTNYLNTFIEVAEDSTAVQGQVPQSKGDNKTIAEMQYQLIAPHPYKYTSDNVLFQVYADKNDLTEAEYKAAREAFFSKGQACLRASPLTKKFGFGIHADDKGKIALYGINSGEYEAFVKNPEIKKVKAMRSTKK